MTFGKLFFLAAFSMSFAVMAQAPVSDEVLKKAQAALEKWDEKKAVEVLSEAEEIVERVGKEKNRTWYQKAGAIFSSNVKKDELEKTEKELKELMDNLEKVVIGIIESQMENGKGENVRMAVFREFGDADKVQDTLTAYLTIVLKNFEARGVQIQKPLIWEGIEPGKDNKPKPGGKVVKRVYIRVLFDEIRRK